MRGTLVLWALIILFSSQLGWSQTQVVIGPTDADIDLSGHISYFVEVPTSGQKLKTLQDVVHENFQKHASAFFNFDYSKNIYWLRFSAENPSESSRSLTLEIPTSWIDLVTLYEEQGNQWTERSAGDSLASHSVKEYRYPTFHLKMQPHSTVFYYLRITGADALVFPLRLMESNKFFQMSIDRAHGLGMYFGLILVLALYNFIIFSTLKDRNYLYYICYILSLGAMQGLFEGYGSQYFWYDDPWFGNRILAIGPTVPMFFSLLFGMNFLDKKKLSRTYVQVLKSFSVFFAILIALPFIANDYTIMFKIMLPTSMISFCVLFAAALTVGLKKSRTAWFFLLAWMPVAMSVIIYALTILGLLDADAFNLNAMYYGVSAEAILLSFALADRMKSVMKAQSRLAINLQAQLLKEAQSRSVMAGKASHHLNNPFLVISGSLENIGYRIKHIHSIFANLLPPQKSWDDSTRKVAEAFFKGVDQLHHDAHQASNSLRRAEQVVNALRLYSGVHGIPKENIKIADIWQQLIIRCNDDDNSHAIRLKWIDIEGDLGQKQVSLCVDLFLYALIDLLVNLLTEIEQGFTVALENSDSDGAVDEVPCMLRLSAAVPIRLQERQMHELPFFQMVGLSFHCRIDPLFAEDGLTLLGIGLKFRACDSATPLSDKTVVAAA